MRWQGVFSARSGDNGGNNSLQQAQVTMKITTRSPARLLSLIAVLTGASGLLAACAPPPPPTAAYTPASPSIEPTPAPTSTPPPVAEGLPALEATTADAPNPAVLDAENALVVRQIKRLGQGTAEDLAWWPDGQYLVVAGSKGIHLYDAQTLVLSGNIETGDWLHRVAFSPDGLTLALWGQARAELWDTAGGQVLKTLQEYEGNINSLAFSPDGRTLAVGYSGGGQGVQVWDSFTGQLLQSFESTNEEDRFVVAYSPDSGMLAWGSLADGRVTLWDTLLGRVVDTLNAGPTASLAFGPRGELLATGQAASSSGSDQTAAPLIQLWDGKGVLVREMAGHTGTIASLTFNPDGRILASGSTDGTVRVWDTATGQPLYTLEGHYGGITRVIFSPDGERLISLGEAGDVRVWAIRSGQLVGTLNGHVQALRGFALAPDGSAAAGSADGLVRIWDPTTAEVRRVLEAHTGHVESLAFSPDGRILATGGEDGAVRLWDAGDGRLLRALDRLPGTAWSLAFSPDGRTLATGGDDTAGVELWDAASGERLRALPAGDQEPPYEVWSLAFSPDGRYLAAASSGVDSRIRVWDVQAGQLAQSIQETSGVLDVALSADGALAASAGRDGTVRLWDMPGGRLLAELRGHRSAASGVAFSPDGRLLASAGWEGTVRLWDVAARRSVRTLEGHSDAVLGVAFTPDGTRLASASADGTIEVWGLP